MRGGQYGAWTGAQPALRQQQNAREGEQQQQQLAPPASTIWQWPATRCNHSTM